MNKLSTKLAIAQKCWQCCVCLIVLVISTQTACSHSATTNNSTMAADIYTQLAQHYWQNGYYGLAKERLQLALKQDPNYEPALALKKLWY